MSTNGGSTTSTGGATNASSTTTAQTSSSSTSTGATRGGGPKDANDGDQDAGSDDDPTIVDYGRAADPATARTLINLVKRYYAAAAAEDGATACPLLFLLLEESVPEDYGQPPGPPALRGKTCAVVMTKFFKQQHSMLARKAEHLKVTGVRVGERKGYVLLSFGSKVEPRHMPVHIQFGTWKIDSLFDEPLP